MSPRPAHQAPCREAANGGLKPVTLLTPWHQCWALGVCPTRASSGCPVPGPAQMTPDWPAQCGLSGHRPRPVPTLSSLTHVVCLGSQIRCGAETSGPGSWVAPSLPVPRRHPNNGAGGETPASTPGWERASFQQGGRVWGPEVSAMAYGRVMTRGPASQLRLP